MLQSKAGYIDARPLPPDRQNSLATHGRTIHWVKMRKAHGEQLLSALASQADSLEGVNSSELGQKVQKTYSIVRPIACPMSTSLRVASIGYERIQ